MGAKLNPLSYIVLYRRNDRKRILFECQKSAVAVIKVKANFSMTYFETRRTGIDTYYGTVVPHCVGTKLRRKTSDVIDTFHH